MFKSWKSVVVAVVGLIVLAGIAEGARRINRDAVLMAGHDGVDQQVPYVDSNGIVATAPYIGGVALSGSSSGADGVINNAATNNVTARGSLYNGATWDRAFTCPTSAVINVSAAATTELVPLSGSTVVRVCSFIITGDTAATVATFVDGTGTNCGTSPSNMTGAMRMVDEGSLALSSGNGSLFRGRAGRAICLTAATGAVTGLLTYAQY